MTMFSLTEDSKGKSLVVLYSNDETEIIPDSHVSFQKIIDLLVSGKATDEEVRDLAGVLKTVARKMSALSERVSADGSEIYFDGDPLRGELADVIKAMFIDGNLNFKPLVNFLEKAKTNPSLESVDALYRWITNGDLVIDPDGDIIAYKGVKVDKDGVSRSISSGTAFVNGVETKGNIPNVPGTVISMPRSEVNADGKIGCSTGLHAGTYGYASNFSQGRLILVKINPRDVVSVPDDSSFQKLRVSRYTVLQQIEHRLQSPIYQPTLSESDEDDEDDWYDEEEDDEYGYDYDYEDDFLEDEDEDEDGEDGEDEGYTGTISFDESADYWSSQGFLTSAPTPEPEIEEAEDEEETPEEDDLPAALRAALNRYKAAGHAIEAEGR